MTGSDADRMVALSRPSIGDEEIAAVTAVLESGWLTTGEQTRLFEQEFAESVGAGHAVAVTSGTAGLHLLMMALGLREGDEVITPSMTWPATVNTIVLAGGSPVFVDVDAGTRNVEPEAVRQAVGPRTRAAVVVHFAGAPCDLDALRAITGEAGIPLIEDAAHAVGAAYRDRVIGGGDATAVFSFHPMKNMTTGEGGMITTPDGLLADRLRRLRFHGVNRDSGFRAAGAARADYDVAEPGLKYNMTDLQAALGRVQLRRLPEFQRRREEITRAFDEVLRDVTGLALVQPPDYPHRHARHLYSITVEGAKADRGAVMRELAERGVQTGIHFTAVHLKSGYIGRFGAGLGALPATERLSERVLSLPLYPAMDDGDVRHVLAAVSGVFADIDTA